MQRFLIVLLMTVASGYGATVSNINFGQLPAQNVLSLSDEFPMWRGSSTNTYRVRASNIFGLFNLTLTNLPSWTNSGGDVYRASNNVYTASNRFTQNVVIYGGRLGIDTNVLGAKLTVNGDAVIATTLWASEMYEGGGRMAQSNWVFTHVGATSNGIMNLLTNRLGATSNGVLTTVTGLVNTASAATSNGVLVVVTNNLVTTSNGVLAVVTNNINTASNALAALIGSSGGDVYAASNNVFTGSNTFLGSVTSSNVSASDLYLSNALAVSVGGTGQTNFTVGKLLAGNGTNIVEVTLSTNLSLNTNTWTLTTTNDGSGGGSGTMTNANVASFIVTNRFQNLTHDLEYGTGGTNVTVDLSTGNNFRLNATNNFYLTFANVADGQSGHLLIVQDTQGASNTVHTSFLFNTVNVLTNSTLTVNTGALDITLFWFQTVGTNVFVQTTDPIGTTATVGSGDFTIAILPDPQGLTTGNEFTNQAHWVATNKTAWNIVTLASVGDLTDDATNDTYWTQASNACQIIKAAGIPSIFAPGNHDIDNWGTYTHYNAYLPQAWVSSQTNWTGGFQNGTDTPNHYLLQTNAGIKMLFIALEIYPRQAVIIPWANALMAQYSNHMAIVLTHAYLNNDGSLMGDYSPYGKSGYGLGASYANAQDLWVALRTNVNLTMILCGHETYGASRLDSANLGGRWVHQIKADYQDETPTKAYLRLMVVHPAENIVDNYTVDTKTGAYLTGPDDQFSFPLVYTTAEQPDTTNTVDDTGLRLLLACDEGTGTNAFSSVNTNYARLSGTSRWYTGHFGNAFAVSNAAGSEITGVVPSAANLLGPGTNLTVSFWCNGQGMPANGTIIAQHNSNNDGEFWIRYSASTSNRLQCHFVTNGAAIGRANFTDASLGEVALGVVFNEEWHHYAMVYDGAHWRFYTDGTLVKEARMSGNVNTYASAVSLGCYAGTPGSGTGSCFLDDIRMYFRTLTPTEIRQVMNGNVTSHPSRVVHTTLVANGGGIVANAYSGRVRLASTAAAVYVTNNLCTANSIVIATLNGRADSMFGVGAYPSDGLIQIVPSVAADADVDVSWILQNP